MPEGVPRLLRPRLVCKGSVSEYAYGMWQNKTTMETSMAENETNQELEQGALHEHRVFNPPADFAANATISGMDAYRKLCDEAASDYEGFWARLARENIEWQKPFTQTLDE